ncbi:MAG: hypothetical protein ACOYU3_07385 [Bacillota bacterium]
MIGQATLTKKQVLEGLKSLIDDRKSFVTGKGPEEIFLHDIAVLEAAHRIVNSAQGHPKGEWLKIRDDYGHHYVGQCSRCGCEPLRPFGRSTYNFCPNCGADMRK